MLLTVPARICSDGQMFSALLRMLPVLPLAGLVLASASAAAPATGSLTLASPDGNVLVEFSPDHKSFGVQFQKQPLLRGTLGLNTTQQELLAGAELTEVQSRTADTTYTMPYGKRHEVRDNFQELDLEFTTAGSPIRYVHVIFRAYDDGVAYRYEVRKQPAQLNFLSILDEPGRIELAGDPKVWPLYLKDYRTGHEGIYMSGPVSQLETNRLIDLPLLAEFDQGISVSITEASLRHYGGLYLKAEGSDTNRALRFDFAPFPPSPKLKARPDMPFTSPWRVFVIGNRPGQLLESDLILNLNEPSVIADASWLRAGKTTFSWWNGTYQEAVPFKMGLNWETMQHYINFCGSNHIAFHGIYGTEDEYPWYAQTDPGFNPPGKDADVRKVRGDFPMERVTAYAKSQNVGIRLWVHWQPLYAHLEEAFTQYEKWGIHGLMVDFLERDDQEMVEIAEKILASAAKHHLHIQFHGAWKPTGLERTYPNLQNHEAVLNLEWLKWSDLCTPEHNVTVPFTRMVAGAMDYHLGGFRSVARDQFKAEHSQPKVLGTRCHHLAMYVVYDNPLPMVADAPSAYVGQPGFNFLRDVPTTWDDTRVLTAQTGDYIVTARRSGDVWYVGAMTDWTARELTVPLDFLPRGKYLIETWADSPDTNAPNAVLTSQQTLTQKDSLKLTLQTGGGQVLRIVRK